MTSGDTTGAPSGPAVADPFSSESITGPVDVNSHWSSSPVVKSISSMFINKLAGLPPAFMGNGGRGWPRDGDGAALPATIPGVEFDVVVVGAAWPLVAA